MCVHTHTHIAQVKEQLARVRLQRQRCEARQLPLQQFLQQSSPAKTTPQADAAAGTTTPQLQAAATNAPIQVDRVAASDTTPKINTAAAASTSPHSTESPLKREQQLSSSSPRVTQSTDQALVTTHEWLGVHQSTGLTQQATPTREAPGLQQKSTALVLQPTPVREVRGFRLQCITFCMHQSMLPCCLAFQSDCAFIRPCLTPDLTCKCTNTLPPTATGKAAARS